MYKAVIIGGGPGGYITAIRLAQYGAKVALIEKAAVGGTCLNYGCIPTKSYLASAKKVAAIEEAGDFGITVSNYAVDFEKVLEKKNSVVSQLKKGIEMLIKKNKIDYFSGVGSLLDKHHVLVTCDLDTTEIEAENIIIATGSKSSEFGIFVPDGDKILNSDMLLDMKTQPKRLMIIGGGVIGCEFASVFKGLGSEVDIIELCANLIPTEDSDVSKELERAFKRKKIKLHLKSSVERLETTENSVIAHLANGKTVESDVVLLALGRSPVTDCLNLDAVDLKLTKGHIETNAYNETAFPGIYAIGDVTNQIKLAHLASFQGLNVAAKIMDKPFEAIDNSKNVPGCVFTAPELSSIGKKEKALEGGSYTVSKYSLKGNGKALVEGDNNGIVKLIFDLDETLIGAAIVGKDANALIHELALAIENKLKAHDIIKTIHAHPTVSEAITEAAEGLFNLTIH